jgi:hypothetical protein
MKKLVVRKFRCQGGGEDCPSFGFEVVKAKNMEVKRHDFLLRSDLEKLSSDEIKVVVLR